MLAVKRWCVWKKIIKKCKAIFYFTFNILITLLFTHQRFNANISEPHGEWVFNIKWLQPPENGANCIEIYRRSNNLTIYVKLTCTCDRPGWRSRYSDSLRMEGPGIESRSGRDFRTYSDRLRGPPSLLYNAYRVFPWVKAAGAWCWSPTPI
jgi:hypothetical protein